MTGGARGIGPTIARRLAAQGTAVGVLDLDGETAHGWPGGCRPSLVCWRLMLPTRSPSSAVGSVADRFGAPPILVNDAGVTRDNMLFRRSE